MQTLERPSSRTRQVGSDRSASPVAAIVGSAENMLASTIDDEYGDSLGDDAGGGLPGMGGGFAQKQYYLDPETKLYMLGMGGSTGRHYDPAAGRFISEDKIRQAAGITSTTM